MVTFNYTEEFLRQAKRLAKRYHSLAEDINALQFELMENPEVGVSLGGGKRKIRLGVRPYKISTCVDNQPVPLITPPSARPPKISTNVDMDDLNMKKIKHTSTLVILLINYS